MADVTISMRLDRKMHEKMKMHDEVNWSAILRKSISSYIDQFDEIDISEAKKAADDMDNLRVSNAFSSGQSGAEIIRKWRDKRK